MNFDFKEQYVAFLDILGFKNIVNGEGFQDRLKHTFNCVEKSIADAKSIIDDHGIYPRVRDIAVSIFSDSIVLSIAVPHDEIEKLKTMRLLFAIVEKIQFSLALENIWLRGGIARGILSHIEGNIVGPAFVKAYEIESQAIYPRVLIDPTIFEDLPEQRRNSPERIINEINYKFMNPNYSGKFLFDWRIFQSKKLLVKDHLYFIDYLNPLVNRHNEQVALEALKNRDLILVNVKENITDINPTICQKYSWVCDYIKSFIEYEVSVLQRSTRRKSNGFDCEESERDFKKRIDSSSFEKFLEELNKI